MDAAEHVPEEVATKLLADAVELLGSDARDERVTGWEIVGDLCNGRPEYVGLSWEVARGRLQREDDPEVVESAVYALGHLAANDDDREQVILEARELLVAHVDATRSDVRLAVAHALPWFLGVAEDAQVLSALIKLTRDAEDEIRDWATFGLGQMTDIDTAELRVALVDRLADAHQDTRDEAMISLARRRDPVVNDTVLSVLTSDLVSTYAVESAALLADDHFLPLLIELREWWDVDPELLEKAISRCDAEARASSVAVLQRLEECIRNEFDRSPVRLVSVGVDDDPVGLDQSLRLEWEDAGGNVQVGFYDLDRLLGQDEVRGDTAVAARRIVEMLDPPLQPIASKS